jgi:preprotein translocase subunit SecG
MSKGQKICLLTGNLRKEIIKKLKMLLKEYIYVAQIIIAAVLIAVFLLQVRGGGLGGIFGQPSTTYRTRRGVERTLFRFTILLVVLLVGLSIYSLRLG